MDTKQQTTYSRQRMAKKESRQNVADGVWQTEYGRQNIADTARTANIKTAPGKENHT